MDDITLDRCESCGHPYGSWCDDECCWWKAERFLEGVAVCDARAASCRCREPAGHYPATPHRCDSRCGGAWRGTDGGDDFEVVAWANGGESVEDMDPLTAILTAFTLRPVPGLRYDEEW